MEKRIEKGIKVTARKMLEAGVNVEIIKSTTNLSEAEINHLQSD